MNEATNLLMPKLGLTMTEGTVARWVAAPHARFAAGDVIVIVETDKIASEVEAPAAGELIEQLSSEGEIVPVGVPIARLRLDGGASTRVSVSEESVGRLEPAAPALMETPSSPTAATSEATRIVATPYARRLAREAALDLRRISGSGPGGRIKAADVARALEGREAPQAPVASDVMSLESADAAPLTALPSFMTADIDVSALKALDARLSRDPARGFDSRAYLVLACLKTLDGYRQGRVRAGVELGGSLAAVEGDAGDTLSSVAERLANASPAADAGGDIAIFVANGRVRLFVPALVEGWSMGLGVGGVRTKRSGEASEMTLTVVYDATIVDHASAARTLDRVAAFLEEPLHLLAG